VSLIVRFTFTQISAINILTSAIVSASTVSDQNFLNGVKHCIIKYR